MREEGGDLHKEYWISKPPSTEVEQSSLHRSRLCADEIEETQVNSAARLSVKAGPPLTKIVSLICR
jgi:hypothetical protein